MAVSGNYNTIETSRLGVNNIYATSCGSLAANPGNSFNGIYITSAASHTTVQDNYLGCNSGGIYIVSTNNAGNHTIGPNNYIGVNASGAGNLGNLNDGIHVGAHNNVVMSNTIGYNDNGIAQISPSATAVKYTDSNR